MISTDGTSTGMEKKEMATNSQTETDIMIGTSGTLILKPASRSISKTIDNWQAAAPIRNR